MMRRTGLAIVRGVTSHLSRKPGPKCCAGSWGVEGVVTQALCPEHWEYSTRCGAVVLYRRKHILRRWTNEGEMKGRGTPKDTTTSR